MRRLTFALLAAAPLAFAQDAGSPDKAFFEEAAQVNLAEVELGRLAMKKSESVNVKAFAQQMVTDHTSATNELQQLAQKKGVTLPKEPGLRHKATKQALDVLSGSAFDKAYIEAQEMDHDRTIALLEKQVKEGKDADARALASTLLPVVQQHRRMVDQIEDAKDAKASGEHTREHAQGGAGSGAAMGDGATGSGSGSTTGNSTVAPTNPR